MSPKHSINALEEDVLDAAAVFRIPNNPFGVRGFSAFVKKLPQTGITVFDASNNELGDDSAIALADMITNATECALEEINLANNNIGEKGGLALVKAFTAKGCNIKRIYLQGNQLTGKVALELARVLPKTQLIYVNLSNNQIDAGGKELAEAIPHTSLEEFYIDNNPLGKGFGTALAKNLITPTPRSDELENGYVSRDELRAIRASRPQTNLTAVGFAHTNATAEDLQAVCIVLGNSGIAVDQLAVEGNAVEINFSNCQTSAAGKLEPPAIYGAMTGVCRAIKEALFSFGAVGTETISAVAQQTKNQVEASQSRFSYFATHNQIQASTTRVDAWFPVIPFVFTGLCLLYLFNKYLSTHSAQAQPHAISAEEKTQLEKLQQKITRLETTLNAQKGSHAGQSGMFADIYTACENNVQQTQLALDAALLQEQISAAKWAEINGNIAAIETNIHRLAQKNRELKKFRQGWQPTHFQHPRTLPNTQTLPEMVKPEEHLLSSGMQDYLLPR